MGERILIKGNEAIGLGAIYAGCRFYFGYPITPQTELLEYMARELPKVDGVFLQSESELAGINMVYGAAAAGKRVMTSSSSPGISLMQEGISYLASAELPAIVVNITRSSPGLGRVAPAQSDYLQATKGGGHGDYHMIVLAPAYVQEMFDLTVLGFNLADQYRTPVMLLGDSIIGQMMEALELPETEHSGLPEKPWAATGANGRARNLVLSAPFTDDDLIALNQKLQQKYEEIAANEARWEEEFTKDAELVVVAIGTSARIANSAVSQARAEGIKVGLLRPITVWPYPTAAFENLRGRAKAYLVVEMNEGQMLEDVKLAVNGSAQVHFYGGGGGKVPRSEEIYQQILQLVKGGL